MKTVCSDKKALYECKVLFVFFSARLLICAAGLKCGRKKCARFYRVTVLPRTAIQRLRGNNQQVSSQSCRLLSFQ